MRLPFLLQRFVLYQGMTFRDPSLDNAKGLLILLVLFGHLAWPVPSSSKVADAAYLFVYSFHMPMFALMSGYVSRAEWSKDVLLNNMKRLLVPYALFMAIQWGLMTLLGKEPYSPFEGHFGLWFLLSLFCWRTSLPWLMKLPRPLVVAMLLSLLSGLVSQIGFEFSLARTLNLLPFFVAGHLMRNRGISPTAILSRPVALALLLTGALAALLLAKMTLHMLLYGGFSYTAMGIPLAAGPLFRSGQILLAFGVGLAALSLLSDRTGILTRFGAHSLHIYLLHSPLLVLYRAAPDVYGVVGDSPFMMLPSALALCWLLSTRTVMTATRKLVSPL